ncbi:MAG: hypothetical protein MI757_10080, partial [Pirellulales bacterium]|nr:hypothetical protein [Pirellulales bacterium]
MSIQYIVGDATSPEADGHGVIVHVCNDVGDWGAGFVMAVSAKWTEPEHAYRLWHKRRMNPPFKLGQVQFVEVEKGLWVANMLGQHDIRG